MLRRPSISNVHASRAPVCDATRFAGNGALSTCSSVNFPCAAHGAGSRQALTLNHRISRFILILRNDASTLARASPDLLVPALLPPSVRPAVRSLQIFAQGKDSSACASPHLARTRGSPPG